MLIKSFILPLTLPKALVNNIKYISTKNKDVVGYMSISRDKLQVELLDVDATQDLARKLAKASFAGLVIYLHGDLGAGKTTFTRALLQGLGYTGNAKSPTFTLVETYTIDDLKVNHFDLYRLTDPSELDFIGFRDYVTDKALTIIEWPARGAGSIPEADLEITLEIVDQHRMCMLQANTEQAATILQNCNKQI